MEFVGLGSAFNTMLGNNAAFLRHDMLIDCGESTFSVLREKNLIDDKPMYVIITHTHPDHVGSLGSLIFYKYFLTPFQSRVHLLIPKTIFRDVIQLLRLMGVIYKEDGTGHYTAQALDDDGMHTTVDGVHIQPIVTRHVDELVSFGYIFEINGEMIYYSGDASEIPHRILTAFNDGIIKKIYHDMCAKHYEGNVHFSIEKAKQTFPPQKRKFVYAMHLDERGMEEALIAGFQIPTLKQRDYPEF